MKESIKKNYKVKTLQDFEQTTSYFLSNELKDERLALYKEVMDEENLESLAAAKHKLLKQIFSSYINDSLNNAYIANENKEVFKAKEQIENLLKLRNIFKNHDVLNYKEFIAESEPEISEIEVDLLFLNPELNTQELNNLSNALITVFGKKTNQIKNKEDFQKHFYSHPLINCLGAYSDYNSIEKRMQNGTLELGKYKDLIETIFSLKGKISQEEYQGFIFYVIKEDLTKGLKNILQIDNYSPQYLKKLLETITKGDAVDNKMVNNLVTQIKEQHSVNFALNNQKSLSQNKNSQFSLNDSGFFVNIDNKECFFHAHETSSSGINQREQQTNTAHILREKDHDTMGVTVLSHNVTNTDYPASFLRLNNLYKILSANKTEEVLLTGLQFDSSHFKRLSAKDVSKHTLQNGDFLMSNQYLVKSDIERSIKLVELTNGKNDYDLLLEKKDAYLSIIEKNQSFFKETLELTSTKNEMSYQLLSDPLLTFVESILKIEKKSKIEFFSDGEVKTIENILTAKSLNTDLANRIEDCVEKLSNRNVQHYEKTNPKVNSIMALATKDTVNDVYSDETKSKKLYEVMEKKAKIKESKESGNGPQILTELERIEVISKGLKSNKIKPALSHFAFLMDSINFKNPEIAPKNLAKFKKNLAHGIYGLSEEHLSKNYRGERLNNMLEGISYSLDKFVSGQTLNFKQNNFSQDVNSKAERDMNMVFSSLLREQYKTAQQREEDLKLMDILLCYAEKCNSKVVCSKKSFNRAKLKI